MISYGLYSVAGVYWLVQMGKPVNAIGLPDDSALHLRTRRRYPCPHNFRLDVKMTSDIEDQVHILRNDPLARFYLPIPWQAVGLRYVQDGRTELLPMLERLWSPTPDSRIVQMSNGMPPTRYRYMAQDTNLVPLTITNMSHRYQRSFDSWGQMEARSSLIVFGDSSTVSPPWVATRLPDFQLDEKTLKAMDLTSVGNAVVRSFMRGELSWVKKSD